MEVWCVEHCEVFFIGNYYTIFFSYNANYYKIVISYYLIIYPYYSIHKYILKIILYTAQRKSGFGNTTSLTLLGAEVYYVITMGWDFHAICIVY